MCRQHKARQDRRCNCGYVDEELEQLNSAGHLAHVCVSAHAIAHNTHTHLSAPLKISWLLSSLLSYDCVLQDTFEMAFMLSNKTKEYRQVRVPARQALGFVRHEGIYHHRVSSCLFQ